MLRDISYSYRVFGGFGEKSLIKPLSYFSIFKGWGFVLYSIITAFPYIPHVYVRRNIIKIIYLAPLELFPILITYTFVFFRVSAHVFLRTGSLGFLFLGFDNVVNFFYTHD